LRFQIGSDGELTQTPAEPIAADARPGKDGKAHARVKLIAGILGVGFDDLRQRELQRRNRRLAIISASAVVGMVFAIGLATTALIARHEAERQRERAEQETETARRTASFMIDLFAVSDPSEARGQSITAREILTNGAGRISTELGDQPQIQASLMDTIGTVYTSLGLYDDALGMLEQAVTLRREISGVSGEEFALSAYHLGNVLTEKAEYELAEQAYREALVALPAGNPDTEQLGLDLTAALAELHFRTGQYELAEPLLHDVLEARRKLLGDEDPKVADAIEELGLNFFDQGKYTQAEARLRESLALRQRLLGEEPHPGVSENLNNLALILRFMGDFDQAERLYVQALEMNHRLYGDEHPEIAASMMNLADIHAMQGELDQAESMYHDVLAMYRKLLGADHPQIAGVLNNLAFLYHDDGKIRKALTFSRASLDLLRRELGQRHPDVAGSLAIQGRWLTEVGNYPEAETALRLALDIQVEVLEPDHPRLATTRIDLAELLIATGNFDEALEQARHGEASLVSSLGPGHWRTASARQTHGGALLAAGEHAEAEKLLVESYKQLSEEPGVHPDSIRKNLQRLVTLYQDWGRDASAQKYQLTLTREFGPG
jgi:tetratricopeptide (TPR) repeat protein